MTIHDRYVYLLYQTLRTLCLPLNTLMVVFILIIRGYNTQSVFNTNMLTPRPEYAAWVKNFLLDTIPTSCQKYQFHTCQHEQVLGAHLGQMPWRNCLVWDTDKNIKVFSNYPQTKLHKEHIKYQVFRSLYLNQLKTYFTAEDNTKQFLVHMVMLMLQLSQENTSFPSHWWKNPDLYIYIRL